MIPSILPPTMLSPPLKIPTGLLSGTKSAGRGTPILCHQALAGPSVAAAATVPTYLTSALSIMYVPTIGIDQLLFDFHFTQPSYEKKK